jgi:hypothetical protein
MCLEKENDMEKNNIHRYSYRMGLIFEDQLVGQSTQLPIQWVPVALSPGAKWPGCEAEHSIPSSAKVRGCMELYLHSSNMPSWHVAQLKKSTGKTLPLPY